MCWKEANSRVTGEYVVNKIVTPPTALGIQGSYACVFVLVIDPTLFRSRAIRVLGQFMVSLDLVEAD